MVKTVVEEVNNDIKVKCGFFTPIYIPSESNGGSSEEVEKVIADLQYLHNDDIQKSPLAVGENYKEQTIYFDTTKTIPFSETDETIDWYFGTNRCLRLVRTSTSVTLELWAVYGNPTYSLQSIYANGEWVVDSYTFDPYNDCVLNETNEFLNLEYVYLKTIKHLGVETRLNKLEEKSLYEHNVNLIIYCENDICYRVNYKEYNNKSSEMSIIKNDFVKVIKEQKNENGKTMAKILMGHCGGSDDNLILYCYENDEIIEISFTSEDVTDTIKQLI